MLVCRRARVVEQNLPRAGHVCVSAQRAAFGWYFGEHLPKVTHLLRKRGYCSERPAEQAAGSGSRLIVPVCLVPGGIDPEGSECRGIMGVVRILHPGHGKCPRGGALLKFVGCGLNHRCRHGSLLTCA